ncbi:MAG: UPF0182 family protein [Thaumarchaeota archaeon]|jgi:uncharacterized membrane protein (UPF0182 family)|nr:UPF0182 family protein [Candidatus Terraquivivens yellowstonensis]
MRVSNHPNSSSSSRKWAIRIVAVVIILLIFFATGSQTVNLILNFVEFGELFIRPFYYALVGGLVLSAIAFFRVDFKNRRSLLFWFFKLLVNIVRSPGIIHLDLIDFSNFKMSARNFVIWQITKTIVGTLFFTNTLFGMSVLAMLNGWDSKLGEVWRIFPLPFITPSPNEAFAQSTVIPALPALLLIIPPLLSALGVRLIVLVGITQLVKSISISIVKYFEEGRVIIPIATIEALISVGLFWTALNSFFTTYIDYNTKVTLIATITIATLFAIYAFIDHRKLGRLGNIYVRIGTIVLVALLAGSVIAIQNSIADARKVEWLGPYVVQEISVNRYLAELDKIKELTYNFSIKEIRQDMISLYVERNKNILSKIRLWDWDAAFTKLKPEIGLIPYVDFEDSDIIRFNDTLYWSASMKPILPAFVRPEDRWFNEHMVYTHVPNGFLMLNAHNGTIEDSSKFFKQRRIYYGEGGLLSTTWSAYIVGEGTSKEVTGHFYSGKGGVDAQPPLSWLFDVTFMLSYPDKTVHIMRYKDVYDRMKLLFPYFSYEWGNSPIDMFPVTDGERTYWLMPLIFKVPAENVPWSRGELFARFVGYSLIDIYDGTIQLIIIGDDFFSELFKNLYAEYVSTEIPAWLYKQTRYPVELFEWRINMYNKYHVRDPATFIGAREFYEIPEGLETYFIYAQPPGFDGVEFVGILSLQLKGALGKNLAGYAVVRNDYPHLGEVLVYKVPLESTVKLLGPTAAIEALKRDPVFKQMETLLRNPRIGDNILYQIGDYPVYFIPVYTAPAEGVITTIGTVAAVGAAFTGEYYVGLGSTPEEAFRAFLSKLAGLETPPPGIMEEGQKISDVKEFVRTLLERANVTIARPEKINAHLVFSEGKVSVKSTEDYKKVEGLVQAFIKEWAGNRVLEWVEGNVINYGVIIVENGIVELHYISIILE